MAFLDVFIFKSRRRKRLGWRPHFKPTSLNVPLHNSSSHPASIHSSWPRAYNGRLASTSSTKQHYLGARKTFVDRLRRFDIDESIIRSVESHDVFTEMQRRRSRRAAGEAATDVLPRPAPVDWAVLPGHPLWGPPGSRWCNPAVHPESAVADVVGTGWSISRIPATDAPSTS